MVLEVLGDFVDFFCLFPVFDFSYLKRSIENYVPLKIVLFFKDLKNLVPSSTYEFIHHFLYVCGGILCIFSWDVYVCGRACVCSRPALGVFLCLVSTFFCEET